MTRIFTLLAPSLGGISRRDPGQPVKRLAADAHVAPFVEELGAHGVVEVDGRRIPVENLPLQAQATLLDGDCGYLLEQRLADAEAAELRMDEQILEIDSRPAQPGGVVEEIEGKAGGLAVVVGDQAGIEGVGAKAIAQQAFLGGGNRIRFPLEGGQGANKGSRICGTSATVAVRIVVAMLLF